MFYEPVGMLKPCAPQITRPWTQVENESREYLGHYRVGLRRQQRVLKTDNFAPKTSADIHTCSFRDGQTHSIGVWNPSTLARSWVNLQMKPYTKSDSQRSDGCVAVDGGHMCPFLSTVGSGAAAFIVGEAREEDA